MMRCKERSPITCLSTARQKARIFSMEEDGLIYVFCLELPLQKKYDYHYREMAYAYHGWQVIAIYKDGQCVCGNCGPHYLQSIFIYFLRQVGGRGMKRFRIQCQKVAGAPRFRIQYRRGWWDNWHSVKYEDKDEVHYFASRDTAKAEMDQLVFLEVNPDGWVDVEYSPPPSRLDTAKPVPVSENPEWVSRGSVKRNKDLPASEALDRMEG